MTEELWYNPNEYDHEMDNEVLDDLLQKGIKGELGKEYDQLKSLLFDLAIEDRQKAMSIARHSLFPSTDKSVPQVQFSKYHLDFAIKEGEKCKVGVILKDKLLISNKGSSKVLFNFSNIPIPSKNIKLAFTPSSGTIKKGSSLEVNVEMTVLCTTKVRELIGVDISNSGRFLLTIKIDSKMSQVLDYAELELGGVIGGGGYGVIHKAKWRGLSVAVKAISEMSDGSEFEKELEMHKELLHHPNIVHFVGFCISPRCLVLEYIEGGSLDKYLGDPQSNTWFTPQLRLKMAFDIAKGMCFLHRNEILHLDLKPQNFLVVSLSLEAQVNIKLADFGLATASSRSFYGSTVAGSFLYNSPEVFTQKKFSRAADVWSYGACLIEILTGKRPYQEYDELGYLELARVREEGFPPMIPDEIDIDMKKIIESCFHKDHTKRPSFEHIESFLSHKCQDILSNVDSSSNGGGSSSAGSSFSSSPSPLSLSKDGNNGSFGSSSSSFLFSKLQQQQQQQQRQAQLFTPPRPSTPIPQSSSPSSPGSNLLLPSLYIQQRKINASQHPSPPSPTSNSGTSPVLPNPSQPSLLQQQLKSPITSKLIQKSTADHSSSTGNASNHTGATSTASQTTKLNRAMTESSTSSTTKIELPPRSTTISSVTEKPKIVQNHRPLPIPLAKSQSSSQIITTLSKPSSQASTVVLPEDNHAITTSSSVGGSSLISGTKIKPLSSTSSSTPQIQIPSSNHKPLIRAASSIEIKNVSKSASSIPTVVHSQDHNSNNNNNNNNSSSSNGVSNKFSTPSASTLRHSDESSSSSTSSTNLLSHLNINDSVEEFKVSELKIRSLKWLKDKYLSFSNVIRSFSEIKSLKECIELGQKVRNFKKDLELLCIEHMKIGWDSIHSSTKQIISKPHLLSVPSPHPSHFDGDTYNKVTQLRDAAIIVGESALDGLFYLITQLSPVSFKSISPSSSTFSIINEFNINLLDQKEKMTPVKLTTADKDTIVKIAKITKGIKDF